MTVSDVIYHEVSKEGLLGGNRGDSTLLKRLVLHVTEKLERKITINITTQRGHDKEDKHCHSPKK